MNITIRDITDYDVLAEIEAILSCFDVTVAITDRDDGATKQHEKPWNTQLTDIIWHIQEHLNGLAEAKAMILRDQIQKGDWTLGAGTENNQTDDGVVKMHHAIIELRDKIKADFPKGCSGLNCRSCLLYGSEIGTFAGALNARLCLLLSTLAAEKHKQDVADDSIETLLSETEQEDDGFIRTCCAATPLSGGGVDIIVTAPGAQPDEDAIEERMCAFCGRDDPCVICGGDWFCDGKCADNHTANDALLTNFKDSMIEGLSTELDYCKSERMRFVKRIEVLEAELADNSKDSEVLMQVIEDLESKILMIPDNFWSVVWRRDAIIKERDKTIDIMEKRHANRKAHIYNLENTIKQRDKTIEDLRTKKFNEAKERHEIYDKELAEQRAIINRITFLRANEVETRQGIEAELYALKGESATLRKVVELVRNCNYNPAATYRTMHEIVELFAHYTEPKERSPDAPEHDK